MLQTGHNVISHLIFGLQGIQSRCAIAMENGDFVGVHAETCPPVLE